MAPRHLSSAAPGARLAGSLLAVWLMSASHAYAKDDAPRLSFNALGPVKIGLPVEAVDATVGPLTPTEPPEGVDRCHYVETSGLSPDVLLMIRGDQVSRIDVVGQGVRTISGARIGMRVEELRRLYGARLTAEPHKYAYPEGEYLTLQSRDGRHAIRFETDGDVVTSFYAGTPQTVTLSEGCQ